VEISEIAEEEEEQGNAVTSGGEGRLTTHTENPTQINHPAPTELGIPGGGVVLIVEDNLMNQKVAKVVVKRCGMRADVANNGREAIDALLRGGQYDVILMDIQMPVLDGLDATREIRALENSGKIDSEKNPSRKNFIVAVSANAAAEDHQQGFEAGMDEYITKPIYPTRLRELLMMPKR
jgi:CheY-like chemotaxis protein